MNQRLQQFIQAENLSQAQFADLLKVARASVSNILSGRNKPGFDFLESLSLHFPDLNLEWLVTGRGRMYKSRTESLPSITSESPVPTDGLLFPDSPGGFRLLRPLSKARKKWIGSSFSSRTVHTRR